MVVCNGAPNAENKVLQGEHASLADGQQCRFCAVAIGRTDKVVAVKLDGAPTINPGRDSLVVVYLANGASLSDARLITKWQPLSEPVALSGTYVLAQLVLSEKKVAKLKRNTKKRGRLVGRKISTSTTSGANAVAVAANEEAAGDEGEAQVKSETLGKRKKRKATAV